MTLWRENSCRSEPYWEVSRSNWFLQLNVSGEAADPRSIISPPLLRWNTSQGCRRQEERLMTEERHVFPEVDSERERERERERENLGRLKSFLMYAFG